MAKAKKKERDAGGTARYTEQIVLLVSKDARAAIEVIAEGGEKGERRISRAEAARNVLHAGLIALGYTDLVKTDDDPRGRRRAAEAITAAGLTGTADPVGPPAE